MSSNSADYVFEIYLSIYELRNIKDVTDEL